MTDDHAATFARLDAAEAELAQVREEIALRRRRQAAQDHWGRVIVIVTALVSIPVTVWLLDALHQR